MIEELKFGFKKTSMHVEGLFLCSWMVLFDGFYQMATADVAGNESDQHYISKRERKWIQIQ